MKEPQASSSAGLAEVCICHHDADTGGSHVAVKVRVAGLVVWGIAF